MCVFGGLGRGAIKNAAAAIALPLFLAGVGGCVFVTLLFLCENESCLERITQRKSRDMETFETTIFFLIYDKLLRYRLGETSSLLDKRNRKDHSITSVLLGNTGLCRNRS